jgi:hypothetical protein
MDKQVTAEHLEHVEYLKLLGVSYDRPKLSQKTEVPIQDALNTCSQCGCGPLIVGGLTKGLCPACEFSPALREIYWADVRIIPCESVIIHDHPTVPETILFPIGQGVNFTQCPSCLRNSCTIFKDYNTCLYCILFVGSEGAPEKISETQ